MNQNQSIVVRSSSINGSGVFAVRLIRCDEVAVKWEDTREISKDQLASLPLEDKNYIDIQGDKILLIGKPERFINHSCDANTRPGDMCDIASRDIQAGEEITADYSNFYIPSGEFQCTCGRKNCRNVVRGILAD